MGILVLASATGSPGVTTSALGLALHWPRDVLLVDADRVPAQVVEAGFLAHASTQGRGLMALAQAHREGRDLPTAAWELSVPLYEEAAPPATSEPRLGVTSRERRFLAGFTHPAGGDLFAPLWGPVADAFAQLGSSGVDVLIDGGRIGSGLPSRLMERADAVMVVTRSSLRALAGLRIHLPPLLDAVDLASPDARTGLLVVGPGQPYSTGEITGHFGVPVMATLPDQPDHAAVLTDAAPPPRRFPHGAFNRGLDAAALRLSSLLTQRLEADLEGVR